MIFMWFLVSVKMNMLLMAPGLLLLYLFALGVKDTFICLSICALIQVLLGLPFLLTYPYEYLQRSFELGRVFMYKWTVNFKFLPEEIILSKSLSIGLLIATIVGNISFWFNLFISWMKFSRFFSLNTTVMSLFAWKWNSSVMLLQ